MPGALDSVLNIAMAGAIVDTYESSNPDTFLTKINILMLQLQIAVAKTLQLWETVNPKYYKRIDKKILKMREISCLGQPESIIVYIDFMIIILEVLVLKCNFDRSCAVKNIIEILTHLRYEFSEGTDEFECSQKAIQCEELWNSIQL